MSQSDNIEGPHGPAYDDYVIRNPEGGDTAGQPSGSVAGGQTPPKPAATASRLGQSWQQVDTPAAKRTEMHDEALAEAIAVMGRMIAGPDGFRQNYIDAYLFGVRKQTPKTDRPAKQTEEDYALAA